MPWPRHLALAVIELAVRDLAEPSHCARVAEKELYRESARKFFQGVELDGWCGIAEIRVERVRELHA
jgi:hypothetical protein